MVLEQIANLSVVYSAYEFESHTRRLEGLSMFDLIMNNTYSAMIFITSIFCFAIVLFVVLPLQILGSHIRPIKHELYDDHLSIYYYQIGSKYSTGKYQVYKYVSNGERYVEEDDETKIVKTMYGIIAGLIFIIGLIYNVSNYRTQDSDRLLMLSVCMAVIVGLVLLAYYLVVDGYRKMAIQQYIKKNNISP